VFIHIINTHQTKRALNKNSPQNEFCRLFCSNILERLLIYFFSAGAAGASAGAAGAAGAAVDICFCSGAGAGVASGAGASSFFLQPAVMAIARVRHRAKDISFLIDFSLLF
jgi:hypothetical protein